MKKNILLVFLLVFMLFNCSTPQSGGSGGGSGGGSEPTTPIIEDIEEEVVVINNDTGEVVQNPDDQPDNTIKENPVVINDNINTIVESISITPEIINNSEKVTVKIKLTNNDIKKASVLLRSKLGFTASHGTCISSLLNYNKNSGYWEASIKIENGVNDDSTIWYLEDVYIKDNMDNRQYIIIDNPDNRHCMFGGPWLNIFYAKNFEDRMIPSQKYLIVELRNNDENEYTDISDISYISFNVKQEEIENPPQQKVREIIKDELNSLIENVSITPEAIKNSENVSIRIKLKNNDIKGISVSLKSKLGFTASHGTCINSVLEYKEESGYWENAIKIENGVNDDSTIWYVEFISIEDKLGNRQYIIIDNPDNRHCMFGGPWLNILYAKNIDDRMIDTKKYLIVELKNNDENEYYDITDISYVSFNIEKE